MRADGYNIDDLAAYLAGLSRIALAGPGESCLEEICGEQTNCYEPAFEERYSRGRIKRREPRA